MISLSILKLHKDGELKDFQHKQNSSYLQDQCLTVTNQYLPPVACRLDQNIYAVQAVVNIYDVQYAGTLADLTNARKSQGIIPAYATFTGKYLKTALKGGIFEPGIYELGFYVEYDDHSTELIKSELFKMNNIQLQPIPSDPIEGGGGGTVTISVPANTYVKDIIIKPTLGIPTITMQTSVTAGDYIALSLIESIQRFIIDLYFENPGTITFTVTGGEIAATVLTYNI